MCENGVHTATSHRSIYAQLGGGWSVKDYRGVLGTLLSGLVLNVSRTSFRAFLAQIVLAFIR